MLNENGKYKPKGTELKMKFDTQCRFATGMAMKLVDGEMVGFRLPIFEYSNQRMVTNKDYESKFDEVAQGFVVGRE